MREYGFEKLQILEVIEGHAQFRKSVFFAYWQVVHMEEVCVSEVASPHLRIDLIFDLHNFAERRRLNAVTVSSVRQVKRTNKISIRSFIRFDDLIRVDWIRKRTIRRNAEDVIEIKGRCSFRKSLDHIVFVSAKE